MLEKKEKIQTIRFPDVSGNFFILYEDEKDYLHGWMSLEGGFDEFLENIQDQLKLLWGEKDTETKDYIIYYIDVLDKYNLVKISNNDIFQELKNQKEIYIVVLHKNIDYKIIQNIPIVYEWFIEGL